jgi:hypothetical protein
VDANEHDISIPRAYQVASSDFAFKITGTVKTLAVNFGDLALALEDQGGELHVYYFNTETGVVSNLSEDFDEAQLHEIREEGFGRFIQIEPMKSASRIPHHGGLRRGAPSVSTSGEA